MYRDIEPLEQQQSHNEYIQERLRQLREDDFSWWVYRDGGCEELGHADLDGLALEPGDTFWASNSPPRREQCDCYVVGARSARGVARLGGDLEKTIPAWCRGR